MRDGRLLAAAPSFDALVVQVSETPDVLLTKLPAHCWPPLSARTGQRKAWSHRQDWPHPWGTLHM